MIRMIFEIIIGAGSVIVLLYLGIFIGREFGTFGDFILRTRGK